MGITLLMVVFGRIKHAQRRIDSAKQNPHRFFRCKLEHYLWKVDHTLFYWSRERERERFYVRCISK